LGLSGLDEGSWYGADGSCAETAGALTQFWKMGSSWVQLGKRDETYGQVSAPQRFP
jgi:hypothetical protein